MPTLLEKGKIIKQKWMDAKDRNFMESASAAEFIVDFIKNRVWQGDIAPQVKIRSYGDKVLVLRAGTGSGKSTVLPTALHEEFKGNIIITEPTRASTVEIPHQIVGIYKNYKLGVNIGYQTGIITRKTSGVMFTTIGILLQYLRVMEPEDFCKKFRFVLIDEAHKRSLEFDNVVYLLRNLLIKMHDKPICPFVVFMSGTLEPAILMDYFKTKNFIDVMGQSFKVSMEFSKVDITNPIFDVFSKIKKIHETQPKGENEDIIVFLNGGEQIKQIKDLCQEYNANAKDKLAVIGIMSKQMAYASSEYQLLYSPLKEYTRRCILATNALETGITIDTLTYCIDTGMVKEKIFNPEFGIDVLIDKPTNQASVMQRKGRVGRKKEGQFYATYTKNSFEAMEPASYPAIITEDISDFVLSLSVQETKVSIEEGEDTLSWWNPIEQKHYRLKYVNNFDIRKIDLLTSPSSTSLEYSIRKLFDLGFVDHLLRPTIFGYLADKIREIRIEAKRMILAGFYENAAVNCLITIAIMLNYGKDLKKKMRFNDDDLIDYVITFEKYIDNIDNRDWEAENKIPSGTLNKIIAGRDQLIKDMLTLGINPWFAEVKLSALKDSEFINECIKIQKCIQSGFKQQTFYYLAGKFTNEKIMVHAQKDAQKIIAGNIIYIDNYFSVDSISLAE